MLFLSFIESESDIIPDILYFGTILGLLLFLTKYIKNRSFFNSNCSNAKFVHAFAIVCTNFYGLEIMF